MRLITTAPLWLAAIKAAAGFTSEPSIDTSCHGYTVNKVTETSRGVQAELDLVGAGCGVYGPDVPELRLTAEYETGKCAPRVLSNSEVFAFL